MNCPVHGKLLRATEDANSYLTIYLLTISHDFFWDFRQHAIFCRRDNPQIVTYEICSLLPTPTSNHLRTKDLSTNRVQEKEVVLDIEITEAECRM